jgi:hypothetical protein
MEKSKTARQDNDIAELKLKLKDAERKLAEAKRDNEEQHASSIRLLQQQSKKLTRQEEEIQKLKADVEASKKKKVVKEQVLPKGLATIMSQFENTCGKLKQFIKKHEVGGKKQLTKEETRAALSAMRSVIEAEKKAYPANFDELKMNNEFGEQPDGFLVLPPQPQLVENGMANFDLNNAEVYIKGEVCSLHYSMSIIRLPLRYDLFDPFLI